MRKAEKHYDEKKDLKTRVVSEREAENVKQIVVNETNNMTEYK